MTIKNPVLPLTLLVLLSSCATHTGYVDKNIDPLMPTLGLDAVDFEAAAAKSVESMLKSGAVNKPKGGRYVLVISRITNDTMQRIDVDQLVKKIRIALLQSGKVVTTTAVSADGAEDKMSMQSRQLRSSTEFNQATIAQQGKLLAPDISLSGKIIQKNSSLNNGDLRVDYYVQLTLTDLQTGLGLWEDERPISKTGDGNSVSW